MGKVKIRTVLTAPNQVVAVVTGDLRSGGILTAAINTANMIGKRTSMDSSKRSGKSKPPRQWPAYSCTVLSIVVQSAIFDD